jgi:hypothetical protein
VQHSDATYRAAPASWVSQSTDVVTRVRELAPARSLPNLINPALDATADEF